MAALSIRQQPDNNDNTRGQQQHNNGGNRMVAPSIVLPTNDQVVDNHHNHYYPPINRSQIEDLRQRLNLKINNASAYDNSLTTTPNKQQTPTTTDQQQQQSTTKKRMLSNRRNSMKRKRSNMSTASTKSDDSSSSSSYASTNQHATRNDCLANSDHNSTKHTESKLVDLNDRAAACQLNSDTGVPCEPGTNILLEGIVWNETMNGVLILNVTWRGKSFVGTLIDSSQSSWAPPCFKESIVNKLKASNCTSGNNNSQTGVHASAHVQSSSAIATRGSSTSYPSTLQSNQSLSATYYNLALTNDLILSSDPTVRTLRNGKRRYITNTFENDIISDLEMEFCTNSNGCNSNTTITNETKLEMDSCKSTDSSSITSEKSSAGGKTRKRVKTQTPKTSLATSPPANLNENSMSSISSTS